MRGGRASLPGEGGEETHEGGREGASGLADEEGDGMAAALGVSVVMTLRLS